VILIVALAIRLVYVSVEPYHAINDAGTYNRLASMIANHGDYHTGDKPRSGAGGSRGPTAYFPPAFPYYLAIADLIDGHAAGGPTAIAPERVEMAVTGTIAVALIGLVALEAFGEAVALASMALAAVYPVFIELSGTLVAENLLVVFELAAAWALLRARAATHPYAWIVAGGVFCGLGALTHENALLYVFPLGLAAWTVARRRPNRTRSAVRALAAPTTLLIVTCATIAPWTIRNAVELHAFVPISDETGITLAGTYNPVSAAFEPVPWKWHLFSHVPEFHHLEHISGRFTEVQLGDKLQTAAFDYIKAHPLAPLEVAFDNTLRMLELEGTYAWQASAKALGIHVKVARVGVWAFYVLAGLALAGIFTAAARRAPRWLWALPLLYALSIVFVNVETPRFREPIDPFLVMLAGCAISAAAERVLGLRGAPVGRRRRPPKLPSHA
jgi:4-amino-4-deoxy-L-arabinose transferase-like glycosyltransferase